MLDNLKLIITEVLMFISKTFKKLSVSKSLIINKFGFNKKATQEPESNSTSVSLSASNDISDTLPQPATAEVWPLENSGHQVEDG